MPISHALPWVKYHFLCILWIILASATACLAMADDFDKAMTAKSSTVDKAFTNTEEKAFLPVGEAFKLNTLLSTHEDKEHLQLIWSTAPHYYLYKERFKFKASTGISLTPSYSEGKAKFDEFAGKDLTVFYDKVTIDFDLPKNTPAFDLQITSQGCADAGLCYPPQTQTLHVDPNSGLVETVNTAKINTIQTPTNIEAATPAQTETIWLWQAMLLALAGGVILNLMPCVFPVLSIKIMSLAQADSARLRLHGWAYTLGILVCFVGFASILLIARKSGEAIGWGFQLQSPGIITALAYLFFVMGLSMSGVIHFGTSFMGAGQHLTQKSGLSGSFFTGALAALVASPCTAPFMGAALGFALTQPAISCLIVFAALGFGMALPLLLLCYLPTLAHRLPKPGLWMETLKEFLAFPLYLSAIWLLWVLGNQAGVSFMAAVCTGALAISFACWLLNRPTQEATRHINRAIALLAFLLAIFIPWQLLNKPQKPNPWQAYTPELLSDLRAQGRPVFIDLTADWCLTCLANERLTLEKADVQAVFDEYKVATLKGDWTNRDPKISALLTEYGRSGVPLYLWFPAGKEGKAEVLPQILTPNIVIDAIKRK